MSSKPNWIRIRRKILVLARNKHAAFFGSVLYGGILTAADIFQDDWGWKQIWYWRNLFWFVLWSPLAIYAGVMCFPEKGPIHSPEAGHVIYSNFILAVGRIVSAKISRFKKIAPEIKKNSDKFKKITDPEAQFEIISNEATIFLQDTFSIEKADQINITIVRRRPEGSWTDIHRHHRQWSKPDLESIGREGSGAYKALKIGEPLMYIDKFEHAKIGEYRLSDRDKRRRTGSAFFLPVSIDTDIGVFEHVICIITYGVYLCDDETMQSASTTITLLQEICRRFELEICLHTIKTK